MIIFFGEMIVFIRRRWFLLLILSLLLILPRNDLFAQDWESLKFGISKRTLVVPVSYDNSKIEVNVVRIDPKNFEIKVIDVLGRLRKAKIQYPVYSLREIVKIVKPLVMINGGFSSSYSLPIAAGLVLENNRTVARLNEVSTLQNGIFCVGRSSLKIVRKEDYRQEDCVYALQSGPILVEWPSKIAIDSSERVKHKKYRRSVVGIDKEGKLLLVLTSDAHLYDLPYKTSWNTTAVPTFPVIQGVTSFNGATTYWEHEIGTDQVQGNTVTPILSFVETGDFMLHQGGDGEAFTKIRRFIPDFKRLDGNATITILLKDYPSDTARSSPLGPFLIDSSTQKVDTRARGRAASLKIENTSSGETWRYGTFRADVQPDGRR